MAYNSVHPNHPYGQQQPILGGDIVSGEQYRYALANFVRCDAPTSFNILPQRYFSVLHTKK